MSQQIALGLQGKIVYSAENFILHAGVSELVTNLVALSGLPNFHLSFCHGLERSGKTHFSIYLYELLLKNNNQVFLFNGQDLATLISKLSAVSSNSIFIFDDMHAYLEQINSGDSGPLVAFIEQCRFAKAKLLFLSSKALDQFNCDQHIMSRLRVGQGFVISDPAESEFTEIFQALSKQRGIMLKDRKIDFLAKRLGRSIPDLERYVDRLYRLTVEAGQGVSFETLEMAFVGTPTLVGSS